jgi:acetyltransferase-like isoleucine patch superfamily enzyme
MSAEPTIRAEGYSAGSGISIGERVNIAGIGGPAESILIGDQVSIGDDVRILARRVVIEDYVTIHNHTTIYGYDEVHIGACTWIGQNAILNCTGPLRIGRGCTISAYSSLWTHFSGGDPIQGCRYGAANVRPCTLEDDVWIGVGALVAPVTIGERALIMAGSVLTKDVPANCTWGGNPAADLTAKLGPPYENVLLNEKYSAMRDKLQQFQAQYLARDGADAEAVKAKVAAPGYIESGPGYLRLGTITVTMVEAPAGHGPVFDLRDRSYNKTGSPEEVAFMRFLLPTIKFWAR